MQGIKPLTLMYFWNFQNRFNHLREKIVQLNYRKGWCTSNRHKDNMANTYAFYFDLSFYYPNNILWILVTKIKPSRRLFEGKARLSPHLTYASHYYYTYSVCSTVVDHLKPPWPLRTPLFGHIWFSRWTVTT